MRADDVERVGRRTGDVDNEVVRAEQHAQRILHVALVVGDEQVKAAGGRMPRGGSVGLGSVENSIKWRHTNQSCLSAVRGSIRAARRAGVAQASRATNSSTTEVPTNTSGSVGLTRTSSVEICGPSSTAAAIA